MPFVRSMAEAAAARDFYRALRKAGARRRPSPASALAMSFGFALLAIGVPLGLALDNDVVLGFTVGVGVVLVLGPAALYLSVQGWLVVKLRKALDAEGWERDAEHPAARRKRLGPPLPFLPVKHRSAPPAVGIGSRWLSLRGFTLATEGDRLILRSEAGIVAQLALVPDSPG